MLQIEYFPGVMLSVITLHLIISGNFMSNM